MTVTSGYELTDRDRQMIVFERGGWWANAGMKDQAILDRFDMTATRYFQVLLQLIEKPAAQAFDPLTVNRLRDQRDRKRAVRSAQRLAG